MHIPDYIIKSVYSHYKRIAENAKAARGDYRTHDAIRLSKKDLQRLKTIIENGQDHKKD